MFYVAILEARPSGRLQYANRFPLVEACKPEKTLQWLSDNLKTTLALSGHLIFYKLKQFIAITVGGQDVKLKCEPFINEDTLNIFGTPAFLKSTFQDLHLDHLGDTEQECICLVAIWTPSSDEYNSRATASLLPISEDNFDREAIIRAAQSRPPPSIGAKSTELISTQTEQRPDAAYNYRPPELAPPPLAIYHPVFARFRHSMAAPTETLEFTSQELDQASTFIDVSLRHYPDETSRLNALQAVITCSGQKFWGERIILVDNGKKIQPDGGLTISIRDLPVLYSTLGELKNGGGDGGCDTSDQAQCAYMKVVSSPQYTRVREVSCCPALLVGLSGHVMAVWGAAFADRFFFERLSLVFVGPQPDSCARSPTSGRSDLEVGIRMVAKLLRTLEVCNEELKTHYQNLNLPRLSSLGASTSARISQSSGRAYRPHSPNRLQSGDPSRFVHWKSLSCGGKEYNLEFHRRLTTYMDKTVFLAAMTLASDSKIPPTNVVVKFACRYGETGHRLLAEAGLAPRIYYCAFDETIGLWVIVMDYVEGVVCKGKLVGGEAKSLTRAIKLLHDNDLVFGDLREPNIIISKPRECVCVVDFEWCGPCKDIKEGGNVVQRRTRYPTNIALSAEYNWAPGVEADRVIAKEHDNHRLQMMV
ncbi:hypothetical protein C8R41DRAFT_810546 [Lentinula lateritia]|uniref:Protein kinase domain-containing protein n=1 Tax=Lentinula lateritia TaxID=40482 RepID=A0ABQ8VW98_9AGAR|nr:hypothetical protein C8R41DRAFT_810546 [Lentinula lateritia]